MTVQGPSGPEGRRLPNVLMSSPAYGHPSGGLARLTEDLRRGLDGRADVTVCATGASDVSDPDVTLVAPGDHVLARVGSRIRFAAAVARLASSRRFDLVHAVTWKSALPVAFLPAARRPPYIVHCNGAELRRGGRVSSMLRRVVLRRAERLVAISRYTRDVAASIAPTPIDLVYPGIRDVPGRTAAPRNEPRLRVLAVGALQPAKGHDVLMRATAAARSEGADLELSIVGRGPQAEPLRALAERIGAQDWCRIATDVDDEQLWDLYRSADIFALLTRDDGPQFEGFGIVFLEAASYGLPIVAGASGGARDAVVEGANAIVAPGEREAAEALIRLWQQPDLRARMGAASISHARASLIADRGRELAEVYRRVLGGGPAEA